MICVIPIKTVNELNDHSFWRARQRRAKAQHEAVALSLATYRGELPVLVKLTRIAPSNGLDPHDGLPASMKFIADAVAKVLDVDDRDPRISFSYAQTRGPYAVRIEITSRKEAA